ncbi:MAG: hypothetical protein ACP5US_06650 [Candidatus Kryptoniota bacterium]
MNSWLTMSIVFHLVGAGMIFTVLLAGPIVEANFRWENDVRMKQHAAKLLRSIGLLSPFGALILVLSGITNMVILDITFASLFGGSATWLGVKLILFVILLIIGMTVNPKISRQRAAVLDQMTQINPPESGTDTLASLNARQTISFLFQWIIVVLILLLTIVRPWSH